VDPMNDLERDLMAAMRVEPSPEFLPRVRARIESEAGASRWRMPRLAWAAGGAALVALAARLMVPSPASLPDGHTTLLPHHDLVLIVPLRTGAPSISPRSVVRPVVQVMATDVLVSRSEMLALQRLFSGAIVAPPASDVPVEVVIPPITVDAITLRAIPEGERQ
jgi:hypothetical protein